MRTMDKCLYLRTAEYLHICPGGPRKARAFLIVDSLPCIVPQLLVLVLQVLEQVQDLYDKCVRVSERRSRTVIRFQWGHRRIRPVEREKRGEGVTCDRRELTVVQLDLRSLHLSSRVMSLRTCVRAPDPGSPISSTRMSRIKVRRG